MDALVLENVSKSFGPVRAVDGLSARIPAGKIYGFLGPNGSGKTTTLRMIMNIFLPDSGRIEILEQTPGWAASRRVGYMPEERGLYPRMRVGAVLSFFGALKGMSRAELSREIPRWLVAVGLEGWTVRRVQDLSRGMRQKLEFVVTVLGDPDLLLLDEPFSGLDPINLDLIEKHIARLRDEGKTILFSTHQMAQAEKLCDAVLLINKGRKVLDGPIEQVRSEHRANAVEIEYEGDANTLEDLPMVERLEAGNGRATLWLQEGADAQNVLAALIGKVRVRSFREKTLSLHEIFLKVVREKDA